MQGLWSRAARLPSSSCRCNACLRTYANGVASRPTTSTTAGRRGLRVGNALTALYSSIFAGAAIADAKAKRKRRQEWDDKIAAVKEEVNELVDEERRLLEVLSVRIHRQPTMQTRSYSTSSRIGPIETRNLRGSHSLASRALSVDEPANNIFVDNHTHGDRVVGNDAVRQSYATVPAEKVRVDNLREETEVNESNEEEIDDENIDPMEFESMDTIATANNSISRPEPDFIWERSSITRIKAIQKLAVQQLAYRLLLRPSIVHDYSGLPVEYPLDESLNQPPNILLARLQSIRRRLYFLKYIKDSPYDDLMQNVGMEELDEMRREVRERYDVSLKQDVQRYLKGRLPLQQLLMQVADNILCCEEPDRPYAFALLISAFSKTHQNDLADLVLKCLIPNLFQFSTPLIIDIISHFRKTKNLKDFDLFLQMLRGEGGYHVNLRTTWQKKTVNGITVTAPPMSSFNPIILTSIITATLRFDQPEKAEAYMHIARANGFVDNFATLSAFLRFYSVRKDYKSGLSTLSSALNFIISSSDLEEKRIARLILYMADFCLSCGRDDLCSTIVHAAAQTGFDCTTAHRRGESTSYLNGSYKKWRQIQEEFEANTPREQLENQQSQPLSEKCASFVAMVGDKISHPQRDFRAAAARAGLHTKSKYTKKSSSGQLEHIPDSASELKSLQSQLQILHLRIEQLSFLNGRAATDTEGN